MANSQEYCIYTSVMNTYCVNKRGFQFLSFFYLFLPLSFFFFPSHSPTTLSSAPPGFLFPFFFLGSRRDLNQRFPVAPACLGKTKHWYLFACSSSNIHNKRTEMCIHVNYFACNISAKTYISSGNNKHAQASQTLLSCITLVRDLVNFHVQYGSTNFLKSSPEYWWIMTATGT